MCGIALSFSKSICREEQIRMMTHALERMQHRGPDDEGLWQEEDIAIGHRRLSIIDLSASRQPMQDPSGRYILTYNGEIYNYKELRSGLEDKWDFQTEGDTEVLLAGMVTKGVSFLEQLEGMWAFALWDNVAKHLLLSRDRMGKKPLYFHQTQNEFTCASELPVLACLQNQSWEEDLDSTADYLRYGYYLPGTTAYKNVKEVLPGYVLDWSPGSEEKQAPYWSLSLTPFQGDHKQACKKLRHLLIRAVERRLVADVEVGAFLSGGVDSSLIVSILTKELGVNLKTFTIGFQERSYDERQYASQVARDCGTDHYSEVLKDWDREKLTNLVLNNVGQPFADSSLLPTALVSSVAASHVKVVLSGDGADELFSGYQRYQARAILRWYTRLPSLLRNGIAKAIRSLPEPMAHHSRSLLKKAHLFQDIVDRFDTETPYVAPVLYDQTTFTALFPDLAERGHQLYDAPEECDLTDIQQMMFADIITYLPQDILLKVDRASMACSLESRTPFLDRQVVEFAFSLPGSWHRHGFSGKQMLRNSFEDILPKVIWKRRKQGFSIPVHSWFTEKLGDEFKKLLHISGLHWNKTFVMALLINHRKDVRDNGHRLWSLYIYLLWKSRINKLPSDN